MSENPQIEYSQLSQEISFSSTVLAIEIYRLENHDCWHLEVVDEYSNSTVWDTAFPTDAEALDAAKRSIAEEGYESFIGPEGGEDKEEWL